MRFSRRSFLMGLPAAALIARPGVAAGQSSVNVRDFGAVGDGSVDDSSAIVAAVATLTSGSILYFPSGQYRFAQQRPPGGAAIVITGLSDVEVRFESGAELVMDNLDAATSSGTSHGILVRGPASNIVLRDIAIRWSQPSKRSNGDGVRVVGYPTGSSSPPAGWSGASAPVRGITLAGCEITGSPQAGIIMMGVSDIDVAGLRVRETRGDGLHFNACQRARIDDYTATDTGDDGLALVTYFTEGFAFDVAAETFSFPALTEWSNAHFTVTNVTVQGGRANGVRLAGANGADITSFNVSGVRSGAGVMVDSASVGSDAAWQYVASQRIRLAAIAVQDSEFGIHVLARPDETRDRRFTDFDVHVTDATIRGCTNWGVRAESLTDLRMTGLQVDTCTVAASSTSAGNGGIGLGDADGVRLGSVSLRHEQPVVVFEAHNSDKIAVDTMHVALETQGGTPSEPPPCIEIDESRGIFGAITVAWAGAPESWHPIRVTNKGLGCDDRSGASPVDIRSLAVDPASIAQPVTRC